jgi:hypothetical protein
MTANKSEQAGCQSGPLPKSLLRRAGYPLRNPLIVPVSRGSPLKSGHTALLHTRRNGIENASKVPVNSATVTKAARNARQSRFG